GYALLALLVEKVSGLSYPDFVRKHIFLPLKMKNSVVYEAGTPISHRVMGHARRQSGEIYANDQSSTSAVKGDGGVYTSLHDYYLWTKAFWNNTLVDRDLALSATSLPIKE